MTLLPHSQGWSSNSPNNPDLLLLELALAKRTPAPTTSSTEAIEGAEEGTQRSANVVPRETEKARPKAGQHLKYGSALSTTSAGGTRESFMQKPNYHLEKKVLINAISVLMQSQELFPNCRNADPKAWRISCFEVEKLSKARKTAKPGA